MPPRQAPIPCRPRVRWLPLVLIAVVLAWPVAAAASADDRVRIGVLAHRGAQETVTTWAPTASYLTANIPPYNFEIVPLDFQQIGPAVQGETVDFVLANTSIYVELEAAYGLTRIATLRNRSAKGAFSSFGGVIFCRNDRPEIATLRDLRHHSFMAVDDTSFGGFRVAWLELKRQGIDPYTEFSRLAFGGTHDQVVYAVRDGKVDAGTVRTDILERMADEGRIELGAFRVLNQRQVAGFPFLLSTPLYPEWPFARLKHTSEELAQEVVIALLRMKADTAAAQAAKIAGWTTPLDYQPVYEAMRELRVGPYRDYGRITPGAVLKTYWPLLLLALVGLALMLLVTSYVIRLNRRLQHSNEFTRTILDSMHDAISIINVRDSTIADVNKGYLKKFGLSAGEALGGTCHAIAHQRAEACQAPDCLCPMRVTMRTKDHATAEYVHRGADGRESYEEVATSPILDQNGNVVQVVHVFRDITERKTAENALRESRGELEKAYAELKAAQSQLLQREKMASIGQLAAGVAHEINNPMGFIMSNLGSLQKYIARVLEYLKTVEDLAGEEAAARQAIAVSRKALKIDYVINDLGNLIAESLEGAERVKEIVQNLKGFARVGEASLSLADINAGLESTINIVWNELKYKAELIRDYGAIPPTLCNPGELNQVFMNLLINAAHAIEKQGKIVVRTWHEAGYVHVSIADTGTGIPPELVGRIFEPFFTTKEVGKGTGLGLSIAYDIVKKHKGEILVESELGKGTTFTIRIPVG